MLVVISNQLRVATQLVARHWWPKRKLENNYNYSLE
jgi:hypothetical protein